MILERKWKNRLEDAKEKIMRNERKTPPSLGRYIIFGI